MYPHGFSENSSLDHRFQLSFFLLISRWFRFPTLPSLFGNLSRQKLDADMEQSPLLVVLKIVISLFFPLLSPGSSWISGRDPLLVVLYCNSPVFTKKICFRCKL